MYINSKLMHLLCV